MSKFHVRTDGTVGECFADIRDCPLGAARHFDTEEEANRISQIVLEQKFGSNLATDVNEAETRPEERESYKKLEPYHEYLYSFNKGRVVDMSIPELQDKKEEMEGIRDELKMNPTVDTVFVNKAQENLGYVAGVLKLKQKDKIKRELEEAERAKRSISSRSSSTSRTNEPSGCGGSSSGCC